MAKGVVVWTITASKTASGNIEILDCEEWFYTLR